MATRGVSLPEYARPDQAADGPPTEALFAGRLEAEARLTVALGPDDRRRWTEGGLPLIVYSDFECRDCRRLHVALRALPPSLIERIDYSRRHFPMRSSRPGAIRRALAAEAAAAQDRFWEMSDRLLGMDDVGEPGLDSIYRFAEQLELDMERFRDDVDERRYLDRIWSDLRTGRDSGVTGTPGVYMAGRRYRVLPLDREKLERDLTLAVDHFGPFEH